MEIEMRFSNKSSETTNMWPCKSHMTSSCITSSTVTKTFTSIILVGWSGDCEVPLCSSHVKMQRLIRNPAWPVWVIYQDRSFDLTSGENFSSRYPSGSTFLCFDECLQGKQDCVIYFSLPILIQKLFTKVDTTKNRFFVDPTYRDQDKSPML